MTAKKIQLIMLACAAASLSACSTVKVPDFDVPGLARFKEASAKLVEGYPDVSKAPARPEDIRSASDWDEAADALLASRSDFVLPEKGGLPESPQAVSSEIEALKAQVRSYKLDDPQ